MMSATDATTSQVERHKNDEEEDATNSNNIQQLLSLASNSVTPPLTAASSLHLVTKLDLSDCNLSSLPSDLPTVLPQLSILFLSNNHFTVFPSDVLRHCEQLQMVAFRSNGMTTIPDDDETTTVSFPPRLRWLILTNNRISHLPATMGTQCPLLQKCMLSGNQLTDLPVSLGQCEQLELLRLASNQLQTIPSEILSQCPKLAWLALGDNPCLPDVPQRAEEEEIISIPVTPDPLVHVLGTGAGGTTYQAQRLDTGDPVAVKVPPSSSKQNSSTMTSDGTPAMEHAVHAYISPSFTKEDDSGGICPLLGRRQNGPGVVLPLLENIRPLAGPPSLTSCTRDVYTTPLPVSSSSSLTTTTTTTAQAILTSILDVLYTLHTKLHVAHGDVYAHNILVSTTAAAAEEEEEDAMTTTTTPRSRHHRRRPLLTDWGAAFYYGPERMPWLERIELRAVAVLAEELLSVVDDAVVPLAEQCRLPDATVEAVHVWWMQHTRLPNMAQQFTDSLGKNENDEGGVAE